MSVYILNKRTPVNRPSSPIPLLPMHHHVHSLPPFLPSTNLDHRRPPPSKEPVPFGLSTPTSPPHSKTSLSQHPFYPPPLPSPLPHMSYATVLTPCRQVRPSDLPLRHGRVREDAAAGAVLRMASCLIAGRQQHQHNLSMHQHSSCIIINVTDGGGAPPPLRALFPRRGLCLLRFSCPTHQV